MKTLLTALCLLPVLLLSACHSAPPASFPPAAAALENAKPPLPSLPVQRWTTPQGSAVLFVPEPALPMLDVQLTFAAGSSRDNGVPGLARLTSNVIGTDTQSGLDTDAIDKRIDRYGMRLSTGSYHDMGVIGFRSLTDNTYLTPNLDLFIQLLSPAFTQTNIDRIRMLMMQGLKRAQQVPGPVTGNTFWQTVFQGHPYAHRETGSLKTLPNIQRQQLQGFYQTYYAAGNAVISLVGDISRQQAEKIAGRISRALPDGSHADPLAKAKRRNGHHLKYIPFDSSQTHILIGNQATYRGAGNRAALMVGNWILGGGGFSSRLMSQVREDAGYVYGISSSISPMAAGGPFIIGLQSANDSAQEALNLTFKVLQQFIANGPTQSEVQHAIDHITGSFPLGLASNSSIVATLGAIGFYDLPSDYLTQLMENVEKVTPAKVKTAMQHAVDPDNLAIIVTGPAPLHWPDSPRRDEHTEK